VSTLAELNVSIAAQGTSLVDVDEHVKAALEETLRDVVTAVLEVYSRGVAVNVDVTVDVSGQETA
jgi:hypothetical protein